MRALLVAPAVLVLALACSETTKTNNGEDDDGSGGDTGPGGGAGNPNSVGGHGSGGDGGTTNNGGGGQGGGSPGLHGDPCVGGAECVSGKCVEDACCGNGVATEDMDGDGFEASVDCNDCDAATNPAALDIVNTDANGDPLPDVDQVDEDCDGTALLPAEDVSCDDDAAVVLDSNDPLHASMALDLCQAQTGDSWGVVSAAYVQIDGTPLPTTPAAHLGHGLLTAFGTNVAPLRGTKLVALSSGTARQPTDPGYLESHDKAYGCAFPPGVPFASTTCPNASTGDPHDSIALRIELKVPTNATELNFGVKYYTAEFPSFICSDYNDIFLARMTPEPLGASPLGTSNITFDANGEPLSINNAMLDVCTPQTAGGKVFDCLAGTAELTDTGFETHAGTSWLTTTAPVTGGDVITLEYGIMDANDGAVTSTILLDDFKWTATHGKKVLTE